MADALTISGVVLTVVFGGLTVFFYLRSRRSKRLCFTVAFDKLQTRNHPDVVIRFNNATVENLCRYKIAFWNCDSEVVRWLDVPPAGPPRVRLLGSGSRILSVATVGASEHVEFKAELDGESQVVLGFVYLNPGDYGLVELLCEEPTQSLAELDAPLIGGKTELLERFRPTRSRKEMFLYTLSPFLAMVALAAGATIAAFRVSQLSSLQRFGIVATAIVGVVGISVMTLMEIQRERQKRRLPAAARVFLGEARGGTLEQSKGAELPNKALEPSVPNDRSAAAQR